MVRAHTVLRSVVTAIQQSNRLPESITYSTWELNAEGGQANVVPPIIEITPETVIRSRPHNTDFVGHATDDNGNDIGYIFDTKFEVEILIDVWTAEGDRYDPKQIGQQLRYAMYRYDDKQLGVPLPDPDSPDEALTGIDRFVLNDGQVANDLAMTPALRRWRQTADVWFTERVNTAEEYGESDYIVNVVGPEDGEMDAGTDVSILYDATPNRQTAADNY